MKSEIYPTSLLFFFGELAFINHNKCLIDCTKVIPEDLTIPIYHCTRCQSMNTSKNGALECNCGNQYHSIDQKQILEELIEKIAIFCPSEYHYSPCISRHFEKVMYYSYNKENRSY